MKFISVRDLRFRASAIRKDLQEQQDLILTANGRPFAILSPVRPENLEEQLLAMRRARARMAVDRLRDGARARGKDRMSAKRIQALISKVRVERRSSASERALKVVLDTNVLVSGLSEVSDGSVLHFTDSWSFPPGGTRSVASVSAALRCVP